MDTHEDVLLEVIVLLGAAVIAVPIFRKIGLGAVLGYLAAGLIVGSSGYISAHDALSIRHFAEFGVIFLLFVIGLELNLSKLWAMRNAVFGLGSLQILITGILIAGYAWYVGVPTTAAIVAGFALALSSTAMGLQILNEKGEITSSHGQSAFAILLMQDLAVIPLIAMIPFLAGTKGLEENGNVFLVLLEDVIAIIGIIVVVRYLLRPTLRFIAKYGSREVFAATAVLTVLAAAWIVDATGLSMALGAFLTGLMLSDSEYTHQIEADVEPFKAPLLGLFFMSVGMSVDLNMIIIDWLWLDLLRHAVAIILIKGLVIFGLCLLFGRSRKTALRVALLLSQSGEFGFVLFGMAIAEGIQSPSHFQLAMILIALSMAATPLLTLLGERVVKRMEKSIPSTVQLTDEPPKDMEGHIIIAGFGRVGETIAMMLRSSEVPYVGLSSRPNLVHKGRSHGHPVYFGDPTMLAVLTAAGLHQAKLVIVVLDTTKATEKIVTAIRAHYPALPIAVRAYDLKQAKKLESLGATQVIPETLEISLQLGAEGLFHAGISDDLIAESLQSFRRDNYTILKETFTEQRG